jgi:hypothetical protein
VKGFPLRRPHELAAFPPERRWLVEGLWGAQAVGLIGGEPKCGKSFLALDLAVAVATGAPALRRFPVTQTGPVLLYAAEDPPPVVRQRLLGIARAANVTFETLDLHLITELALRLDLEADRVRLRDTVCALRPRLLVLDPFVRLHRIDENAASEVAPLLAFLRSLQRRTGVAVVLVHHARKGAAHLRGGQALRGSSELHAWGDSNLYLRRQGERLRLSTEHRAAASCDDLTLSLRSQGEALALHVVEPTPLSKSLQPHADAGLEPRLLDLLAQTDAPVRRDTLRRVCRVRNDTLGHTLARLVQQRRILHDHGGYRLPHPEEQPTVPVP